MRKNLISVSRLESAGFDVNFGNGKVKILLKGKLIQLGNRVEGLYYIEDISDIDAMDSLVAENHSIERNIAGNDNCSESYLWHLRLGHISKNMIKRLISYGILNFK